MKLDYPATQRNKDVIAEALRTVLPPQGHVLEVASGSGQHVLHFATLWPALQWLPSSMEAQERASANAWCSGLANVSDALAIDVLEPWPVDPASVDVVYCANMIHIAPWACTPALFVGAAHVLRTGGAVALYGPFQVAGAHTAPSNASFHASLQSRDPEWGIREREAVLGAAQAVGLRCVSQQDLPANNQLLIFRA